MKNNYNNNNPHDVYSIVTNRIIKHLKMALFLGKNHGLTPDYLKIL